MVLYNSGILTPVKITSSEVSRKGYGVSNIIL